MVRSGEEDGMAEFEGSMLGARIAARKTKGSEGDDRMA